MKTIRRACAVALSGVIVTAMLAAAVPATASADTPERFTGSASAWAIKASILPTLPGLPFPLVLTAGTSHATGDSTPKAHADGAGLIGLGLGGQTVSTADAATVGASVTPPPACLLDIPVQGVLSLKTACSTSAAALTAMGPNATSNASVVSLNVAVLQLVFQLLKPITDLLTPQLDPVISQVTTTLHPILGILLDPLLTSLGIDQSKPVSSLLSTLEGLSTLASVSVLPSVSSVTSTPGAITANAESQGASIQVLPGLTKVLHNPLLRIDVLAATATATFDRGAGTSSAAVHPALVTVHLLDDTLPGFPISVGLKDPITILGGTPLESTIALGAGTTSKAADGSVGAIADGLSIHLLKGVMGGINLDLAHAEAAVGGTKATTTPPAPPNPTAAITPAAKGTLLLATTGNDLPLLPIGFILILAGYLTRRRLVRR